MKKIIIGSFVLASVVLLSGCELPGQDSKKMDVMQKPEDAMMKQDDGMMKKDSTWTKEEMEKMEKDGSMMHDDKMVKDDGMMKKDDSMMKKTDTMKKEDSAMMEKDTATVAGSYSAYSASAVTAALAAKKNVVLFFHATWCPSCKEANSNFLTETAPANTAVFKVDYDTSKELKVKYGITSQHTFVSLNSDGTMKKKASGLSHLSDLAGLN